MLQEVYIIIKHKTLIKILYLQHYIRITGIFIFLLFFFYPVSSQIHTRIEADFSIKEKFADGTQKLSLGKVYFDRNYNKIIYNITFPEPEILVITDSIITEVKENKIIDQTKSNNLVRFSIFNLSLNGDLPYYGLKNSIFQLTNVEEEDNMVITTWETPKTENSKYLKLLLSQVDKKLNGLITFDENDNIISKQFFEEYTIKNGLDFPTKVVQFFYFNSTEELKLINYSNIVINNMKGEEYYNYSVPIDSN